MQWKREAQSNPSTGSSRCGRLRPAGAMAPTRLVWSEDTVEEFTDLHELARSWKFRWEEGLSANRFARDGVLARLGEGENAELILRTILRDIGFVAMSKGCRPTNDGTRWPLGKRILQVFFLRPASIVQGVGQGYDRVCFLLAVRQAESRQFYQWGMQNTESLDVTRPFGDWEVTHLDQVHNKVWVVRDRLNRKAVLKFEVPATDENKEGLPKATERLACVQFVAKRVFDGVNEIRLARREEATEIRRMRVSQGAPYVPVNPNQPRAENPSTPHQNMIEQLNDKRPPADSMLCKIEFKKVQSNLQDKMDRAENFSPDERAGILRSIHQNLFHEKNFRRFGRIAVFDIVFGNKDRFYPLLKNTDKMMITNIDFDIAGQAIPLDNFCPNSPLSDTWEGYECIASPAKISRYAGRVVVQLILKTEGDTFVGEQLKAQLTAAFVEGVELGKRTVVAFLVPYGKKLSGSYGETGREIHRRIALLGR